MQDTILQSYTTLNNISAPPHGIGEIASAANDQQPTRIWSNTTKGIHITSPTCFQEISDQTGCDVPALFMDALEAAIASALAKGN